jgi:hypothetical protein
MISGGVRPSPGKPPVVPRMPEIEVINVTVLLNQVEACNLDKMKVFAMSADGSYYPI